jgi:hypothetical protein
VCNKSNNQTFQEVIDAACLDAAFSAKVPESNEIQSSAAETIAVLEARPLALKMVHLLSL